MLVPQKRRHCRLGCGDPQEIMTKTKIQFHNTMTGRREVFEPAKKGIVSLYVCGLTPYDEVHLGHARCYVVFDVIKRVFSEIGYKVKHVQNFTDVDDKFKEQTGRPGKTACIQQVYEYRYMEGDNDK